MNPTVYEKRPIACEKSPAVYGKSSVYEKRALLYVQKEPCCVWKELDVREKSPAVCGKSPMYVKRALLYVQTL